MARWKLCYFTSHIANKTAAELTCPNPYACFPKHNVLGTYSLNCLRRQQNQPAKRPHPSWQTHTSATLERLASASAPTSIIGPYWHQAIKTWEMAFSRCWGEHYYLHYCGSQRPQPRSESRRRQYKGSDRKLPLMLLTFQRRGKVWVILSNDSHFTGEVLMLAVPPTERCG